MQQSASLSHDVHYSAHCRVPAQIYKEDPPIDTGSSAQSMPLSALVDFAGSPHHQPLHLRDWLDGVSKPSHVPVYICRDIISLEEEAALMQETQEHIFNSLECQKTHSDSVISHYKECYRDASMFGIEIAQAARKEKEAIQNYHSSYLLSFNACRAIQRCHAFAQSFVPTVPLQQRIHFLQLRPEGRIRPHADNEQSSSTIIAGLTLGAPRTMRLTPSPQLQATMLTPEERNSHIDLQLVPRSLYVLCGPSRYDWHHATVDNLESVERFEKAQTLGLSDCAPGSRSVVIFRGMSTKELFQHRMAMLSRA